MMPRNSFLKFDLKKLNDLKSQLPKGATEALDKFQSQLATYEDRAKDLVQKLDSKQEKVRKEVRRVGKQRLNQFTTELKKTRTSVEKKVLTLVDEKRKDLQTRVNDLVIYLTGLAGKDVLKSKKKSSSKSKTAKKATSGRKPKAKRVIQTSSNQRSFDRGAASISQA